MLALGTLLPQLGLPCLRCQQRSRSLCAAAKHSGLDCVQLYNEEVNDLLAPENTKLQVGCTSHYCS